MQSLTNDYLELNSIWNHKKGYEAHRRRLQNVKGSNYQNKKDQELIKDIVDHQIQCNQKKEYLKQLTIRINNNNFAERLIKISQKSSSSRDASNLSYGGQQTMKKHLDMQELNNENKKLRQRLISVQPTFKFKSFDDDYLKHNVCKEHMQKFYNHQNKVKLKAQISMEEYEQQNTNRHKPNKKQQRCQSEVSSNDSIIHSEIDINSNQFCQTDLSTQNLPFVNQTIVRINNITQQKRALDLLISPKLKLNRTILDMLPIFGNRKLIRFQKYTEYSPQKSLFETKHQLLLNKSIEAPYHTKVNNLFYQQRIETNQNMKTMVSLDED